MPDGFEVDLSELDQLAADIGEVPDNAGKRIRQAVEVSARNVKDSWRDKLRGASHLSAAYAAIDYEMGAGESLLRNALTGTSGGANSVTAEIGANLGRRQGALVGFTEFGSPTSAPRGYGLRSLQENEEDFEHGLSKALEDAEREAGL